MKALTERPAGMEFQERAPREDRGDRPPRNDRGPREDRGDRAPREYRGDRAPRGDRPARFEERGNGGEQAAEQGASQPAQDASRGGDQQG